MNAFAKGIFTNLLDGAQTAGHPPITSPEIKHLAGKLLADPYTSPDTRRLAGSVMAHINREADKTPSVLSTLLLTPLGKF